MKACYCHTPGCPNDGEVFLWDDTPEPSEDGSTITMAPPWCGGCSTKFTDIKDAPDPEPGTEDGAEDETPAA